MSDAVADDGRHLGRVVRVVVDDGDAVDLAAHLEAASGATEAGEAGEDGIRLGAQARDGREVGRGGIHDVVVARHREPEHSLDALVHEHRAGAEVLGAHLAHPQVGARGMAVGEHPAARGARGLGEPARPAVVVAGDEEPPVGEGVDEGRVGGLDVLEGAVVVEVVGLHVGDHGDVGAVGEERAVALVGLDDEGRAPHRARRWCRAARSRPRRRTTGRRPPRRSATTSIDVVVVLPLAPATATRRCPAISEASAWDRCSTRRSAARAAGQLDVVVADRRRHHHGVDVGDVCRVVAHVDTAPRCRQRPQVGGVLGVRAR